MVRGLLTVLVVVWAGTADAAPKRKVKITTEPAGATVYLNDIEAGPACEPTPCTVEAPVGETPIIIDLKDHTRVYENLTVPKSGKIADLNFKLVAAVGTIVIDLPVGASVSVDDVDKGKVPLRIEAAAESHHVVVKLKGKKLYDDYLEIAAGGETPVTIAASGGAASGGDGSGDAGGDGGEGDTGDGDGDGDPDGGAVEKVVPQKPGRDRYVTFAAIVDIGFRKFEYAGAGGMAVTKQTLRDEKEGGQILAGPLVEVWVGSLAKIKLLRGLSVLVRYQYGLNKQKLETTGLSGNTNTFWQSMELSLRHRWTFASKLTAELGGGYVRDQYQFEGVADDIAKVPDADYKSIRLGGRVSVLLGAFEPYLTIENRSVRSGGKVATRFMEASPSGFRASLGVGVRHGKLTGRIEGSANQYSWTFTARDATTYAASATDAIRQIGFAVGYEL